MSNKQKKFTSGLITIVIAVLVLSGMTIAGALYVWLFTQPPFPRIIPALVAIVTFACVIAFIAVVYMRLKEIQQEDPDDISKY